MARWGRHIAAAIALAGLAVPALAQGGAGTANEDRPAAEPDPFDRPELGAPARISISADGSTIFLVGRIAPGTFDDFYRSLRAHPKVRTAFVASPGGSVMDGYMIANAVRVRKLATHVEYMCASICPVIFAAGRERVLGRDAQLGFHRTFKLDMEGKVEEVADYSVPGNFERALTDALSFDLYSAGDDKVIRGLRRAGVSDAFIKKALEPPPESAWIPSAEEVLAEKLATKVLDTPAEAGGMRLPADQQSLAMVSDRLATNPFWQALRVNEPQLFAVTALEVWRGANSGVPAREVELQQRAKIDRVLLDRLPTVPDALLEPFLTYVAQLSRIERRDGFKSCAPVTNLLIRPASPESIAHRDANDGLFVTLLENRVTQPKMEPKKVQSQINKNLRRLWETGVEFEQGTEGKLDPVQQCRQGLRVMDAVDQLAPKHRLPTFRAVISS